MLDDLIRRGLRRPEFLIVDGAPGLEAAIAAVWDGVQVQRCTVHKHRNLLAHAPERLHDEITADYNDMIYAATREEIALRRKAFIREWRLKHRAVADSLQEAGDRLFTFTRLPVALAAIKGDRTLSQLAEQFDVHPNQVTSWKAQLEGGAANVFGAGSGGGTAPPAVDVKSLHAKIGELTLENDFLEGALTKAGLLSAKR